MLHPTCKADWLIRDKDRPFAMKCVEDQVAYKAGEIIWVSSATYDYYKAHDPTPKWELLGIRICRKPVPTEDDLDSWFSGKLSLANGHCKPGSYLLQCEKVFDDGWNLFAVGDRIFWPHPAEDFPKDGEDSGHWVTVREWDPELDSQY